MLGSTVFEFFFFFSFFSVFFHCPISLFFFFFLFFIINCSFTIFLNLISASLCLYLNIITIDSCLPVYSISNKYFHKTSMVYYSNFFSNILSSFSKYLYKSMARVQPSFLHFYLFRRRQYNTSFLLTSKDELKYPRGSFLNNPNFYPFGQQHFPLKNNSKPSPQIFRFIQRDRQDFVHTFNPLISKPLFQISKITL